MSPPGFACSRSWHEDAESPHSLHREIRPEHCCVPPASVASFLPRCSPRSSRRNHATVLDESNAHGRRRATHSRRRRRDRRHRGRRDLGIWPCAIVQADAARVVIIGLPTPPQRSALFRPRGVCCSRRLAVRAVWLFAPSGCSRRLAVRAVWLFAPFGCLRGLRFAPFAVIEGRAALVLLRHLFWGLMRLCLCLL